MDLLVGGVRRLSESRKKSRSLPLSARGNPPNLSLASFDDDGGSSYTEHTPKSKVKRKRRSSCLPLPSSSNTRGSSDEIGLGGTSNSDTSCSSVEFLRVHSSNVRTNEEASSNNVVKNAFEEIWSDNNRSRPSYHFDKSASGNFLLTEQSGQFNSSENKGSCDSLSRKERLEALKARIAAERERVRDSSDEESRQPKTKTKLGIWRFHSDEALNRGPASKANGNKTRAARTERYLKRKSQEDVSLKRVTNSDPNLDFLEYTTPPRWLKESTNPPPEPAPDPNGTTLIPLQGHLVIDQTVVAETSRVRELTDQSNSSLITWKDSHAYEDPKSRTSDSSNYQSAFESSTTSKEINSNNFNLPKKSNPGVATKMSRSSPQNSGGIGGHSFLPTRKPSPLTVRTVFGGAGSPFSVMTQPSPCDSGLSSQSMTSSPSIGRAPTPPPRIVKGSLTSPSRVQRPQRPASCSLTSPTENIYGRIISRSPTSTLQSECGGSSGRSSPWWHRVQPGSNNKPPVKPNVNKPPPLYFYTDSSPSKPEPRIYSYTDQAPNYKGSDTSSAYLSDSQLDSMKPYHQSTPSFFPTKQQPTQTNPGTNTVYSVPRPSSLFNFSGTKSPPIIPNGRPLSMVLEKSESLESSISNGIKRSEVRTPPPSTSPGRNKTPTLEQTPTVKATFDFSSEEKERRRRTSANFEDALQELEEIYHSLGLNDEDLLDRAERRDLPTLHQLKRFSIADPMSSCANGGFPLSRSSSDSYSYGARPWSSPIERENALSRTPPNRRSAIPDKVSDDLAIRRLQRTTSGPHPSCKSPGGPGTETKQSYLQCSPGLTPTVKTNGFFQNNDVFFKADEPDVNFDDVTYRMYTQADSVKVPPVHPPFGIPLEPVTKCSQSDYLHATPSDDEKKRINFYKPEANPDVVRDDMAFRNLRRQSKTNGVGPLDAACQEVEAWRKPPARRKDRAVKSLSANMESSYESIMNNVPPDNDKAQSMSDLIAALEQESKKWEAFVKETEVNDSNKKTQGSSTETLTELNGTCPPTVVKTISLPEPIKGKSGAIYSLMCLSDIKKRKERKNNLEKSKSPPPVPKRTSNVVLTKRPPHPKGFWSDSETKSFSSGFGDDSLDDLLTSLTLDDGRTSKVKGSIVKEAVSDQNAFIVPPQPVIQNPNSASSLENVKLPFKPDSSSAHQEPDSVVAMSAETTRRPTLNSYSVKSLRSTSPRIHDNQPNRFANNPSVVPLLDSNVNKTRPEMPSALSSVNPDRVAKYKEERRKQHQARFSEARIKFDSTPNTENSSLGTESPFLRRSLRQNKKSDASSAQVQVSVNSSASANQDGGNLSVDGNASCNASDSALSNQQLPSSRRRFITRDPSESSDTGTLPTSNAGTGLVRSTRASRLRAQAASLLSKSGDGVSVAPRQDGSVVAAITRKITSDSDVAPSSLQASLLSSSGGIIQKPAINDSNDNLATSSSSATRNLVPVTRSIGHDDINSDASDLSSSLGKAKDKSGKRKSNLNRANILDEPRPIPSEAHEAARRTRRIRRTSDSSPTSGSDKLDNPFVRSASLRVSDVTKNNITERLSFFSQSAQITPPRKGSSTDSQGEIKNFTKKRESTDRTGSISNKPDDVNRRNKAWALKKPDIPEVLKVQRTSPVPSVAAFSSTLNQVPKSTPIKDRIPFDRTPTSDRRSVLVETSKCFALSSESPIIDDSSKKTFAVDSLPQVLNKTFEQANSSNDDIFSTPPDTLSPRGTLSPSSELPITFVPLTSVLKEPPEVKAPILKRRSVDEESSQLVPSILRTLRSASLTKSELVPIVPEVSVDKKPSILKKRGSSEEKELSDAVHPILKKHSLDETGSPVQSILKNRLSLDEDLASTGSDQPKPSILKKRFSQEELSDLPGQRVGEPKKTILKKKGEEDNWEERPKPILKSRRSLDEPSTTLDVLGLNRKFESTLQESVIRSILKKSFDTEDSDEYGSQTRPSSILKSSFQNRRNSDDAIVSDSCLVTLNRPRIFEGRRGSVDADNRQSPVNSQPLPSILKRKNTQTDGQQTKSLSEELINSLLGVKEAEPEASKAPKRRGLKVTDGVAPGHVLRERFNRRNVPRYRTQPVTQVEVEETDSLKSVQAFRALIMKKASLNIFEQTPNETKVTPVVPVQPLSPEVLVKPEYPKPYRSERKKKFEKRPDRRNNARYRTLPITVEELAEAEKAEAERAHHTETADEEGVQTSSSDELVKLSVAAKASLFQQKVEEQKASAEPRRLSGGDSAARNRFLNRRSLIRSQTQPVTEEEVHEAAKMGKDDDQKRSTDEPESPTEEPSKLSLGEKMKLFTQKSIAESEPEKPGLIRGPPTRRSRNGSSRFRTQPITTEEVIKASGLTKSGSQGGLAACILKSAQDLASKDDSSAQSTHELREELKSKILQNVTTTRFGGGSLSFTRESGSSTVNATATHSESNHSSENNKPKVIERQEAKMSTTDSSSSCSSSSEDDGSDSEENKDDANLRDNQDSKTVLTGGQGHIVINRMTGSSDSPVMPKKITNLAVQRKYNTSLRQKEERRNIRSSSTSSSSEATTALSERPKKSGPRRSLTQPVLMSATDNEKDSKKGTIADRLAALQRSGTEDWQKRICKTKPETPVSVVSDDEKSPSPKSSPASIEKSSSILALKSKLEESSTQWKARVEEKDAVKFTVAGKMGHPLASVQTPGGNSAPGSRGNTPGSTPILDRKKKVPTPVAFSSSKVKSVDGQQGLKNAVKVLPMGISPLVKSKSMPSALKNLSSDDDSSSDEIDSPEKGSRVLVPKADNETFSSFFDSRLVQRIEDRDEKFVISEDVFKEVASQSHQMLAQKRTVQAQRRKHVRTARNPIRALASRTDLQQEYIEVKTGIAEKEVKRLQLEQLAKNSDKCLSALAGLASTEDFKSVSLRKGTIEACPLLPHSDVMLVQVKGRRHVQTRLVEAIPASVNSGDSYVLITPDRVFCYVGEFANVIERAKVTEVASVIQQKKDLCFKGASEVILLDNEKSPDPERVKEFFQLLGDESQNPTQAGAPFEDEVYETNVISTNKVYTVKDDALVPHEAAWGSLPKIEILDSQEIVVFDFGSEFYVWNGKQAPFEKRKNVARLAKELFEQGYDYSECDINPLSPRMESEHFKPTLPCKSSSRPSWVVFAKINQHMEPVLFREKFSDWPDLTRIIKVKGQDEDNKIESIAELKAFDATEMLHWECPEPDLCLEGSHLGRGLEYYDPEERRNFEILTTSLDVWHILEYERTRLVADSHGQFHSDDTYVVRWNYTLTQIGRDFHGNLSRHSFTGRSRCAYFFWQGINSRITEQGAAALMTIELDEERGPQVRVVQGKEPPCFLNLFEGRMIVYLGERECAETNTPGPWKMFMSRGEFESEAMLVEVKIGCHSLRSRGSFVLVNVETGVIFQWHGSKCPKRNKKIADKALENILTKRPEEMLFSDNLEKFVVKVTEEGKETKEFWTAIGGKKRRNYFSLSKSVLSYEFTPRLFRMTSINGVFEAHEIFCAYGTTRHACAYPFLQSDIYGVPQPALFLLDNHSEVFLWQGWWPEGDEDMVNVATGSANHRFNIDRKCAMETTLKYCQAKNASSPPRAYVIHAGREPLVFTNLFPEWLADDEVVRLNSERECVDQQRHPCLVERVLGQLERKYYKIDELRAQPLPEGVNPTNLEVYLDDDDFYNVFEMTREEFYNLAIWKRANLKKEAQLF